MFRRYSVFFSWLTSYLLVLLIPIISGAMIYVNAEKIIETEVKNSNQVMLEQTQKELDGGLLEIHRFVEQIQINKRFMQLMRVKPNKSDNYYSDNTLQAFDDFSYYRVMTSYINDFFIYIRSINKIVNASALLDSDIYYQAKIESGELISRKDWGRLLSGGYSGQFLVMGAGNVQETGGQKGIVYSLNLPLNQHDDPKATLVMYLNYKKMQGIIQTIQKAYNGYGIVLDKNNTVLFSSSNLRNRPEGINYDQLTTVPATSNMTINGKKSIVSYIDSAEENLKFISIIPYEDFWRKVDAIKLITIICGSVCVLVGLAASYLLAIRNYSPLSKLLSLANRTGQPAAKRINEYKILQDAISETINTNQDMSEKLNLQKKAMKLLFLEKLLKGTIVEESVIQDKLQLYDIKFDFDAFVVVIFSVKSIDAAFEEQLAESDDNEKLSLASIVVTKVFEELNPDGINITITEIDGMRVCLVNMCDNAKDFQNLMRVVDETHDYVKLNFNVRFTAAISDICRSCARIGEAYNEAMHSVEYLNAFDSGDIASYNDIKCHNNRYNYTIGDEYQLINCIKAGDYENGKKVLDSIFEKNFDKYQLSYSLMKYTMFSLATTMMKAMIEVSYICDEAYIEKLHIEDRLMRCEKIKELKLQMTDILQKVCIYIQENKKGKNEQLISGIIEYIENNYQDMNLSVTQISEKFELTSSYLTKLFKEQMSEGIFDYITRVRIEKSKILLRGSGKLNIKEVAEKVGYFSSNVFIRAFKKHEGVTPGLYKGN